MTTVFITQELFSKMDFDTQKNENEISVSVGKTIFINTFSVYEVFLF